MKTIIIFSALIFLSNLVFSQDNIYKNKSTISCIYNIGKCILIQNSCKNELKLNLINLPIDSITCRTDSVFNTDKPYYCLLKSYDANNVLRYIATIHFHIYSKIYSIADKKEILTSKIYRDSLFIENTFYYDRKGVIKNNLPMVICDFGCFNPTWEEFGLDEFGTKTILKPEEIKINPLK